MHNAGGREIHIETVPYIAHNAAEYPNARYLNGSIESHCT